MSFPWQMYLFCVVQFIGSVGMYGFLVWDPCQLLTNKGACHAGAEAYAARGMAIGFLYVGVFFLCLTILNKDSLPHYKRLANMATFSVVAMLVGVMFTGSTSLGGFEKSLFHFLDMITMVLLLCIMASTNAVDSEMADYKSPFQGLGLNPKSFVLFATIATAVKFFVLSDAVNLSSFLADPTSTTHLSNILWTWMNICVLEILFAFAFALLFGTDKDQEALTIATAVMMIVSLVSIIPISDALTTGTMRSAYISLAIVIAIALVAIIGGRKNRQQGYETVSNVV